MSFAKRFNVRKFNIDTTGFGYRSLVDCYNDNGAGYIYPIRAIYINTKSKYGDAPVIATDGYFLNIPSHLMSVVQEMLADREVIDLINAGKCGMKIYPYTAHNRTCYGVEWVDIK